METGLAGTDHALVQKILASHQDNQAMSAWNTEDAGDMFAVVHHAGHVVYDASQFVGNTRQRYIPHIHYIGYQAFRFIFRKTD